MSDRLTPEMLVHAYAQGLFPMADSRGGGLAFYAADPRGVIPLGEGGFHVRRSLAKALRRIEASPMPFILRSDTAFAAVVAGGEYLDAVERAGTLAELLDVRAIGAGNLHLAGVAAAVDAGVQLG